MYRLARGNRDLHYLKGPTLHFELHSGLNVMAPHPANVQVGLGIVCGERIGGLSN